MLKNLLFLAVLGLFVAATYIGVNLFLESTKSTISPSLQKNLEPIDSTFDLQTLESLKNRTVIEVDLGSDIGVISQTQPLNDEDVSDIEDEDVAQEDLEETTTPAPTTTETE